MTRYALKRIANPAHFFDAPDDVLEDDKLTAEEKEKVLQSMAADAEQMVEATAEGMEGPERTFNAEDLRRALARLSEAKEQTGSSSNPLENAARRFRQIVVVTTVNQDLNRVVLELALDLSDMSGGTVSILNVVPPNTDGVGAAVGMPMAGTAGVVNVDRTEILQHRKKLLKELRDVIGADDTLEIEVRIGQIEEEIVGYAEQVNADAIVVGSPNRSWLEGLFDSAIDRSVTKFAPCPVLVVPEPD
ncbi:MAG: universal stress protein [Pseudomonadota bacterium]